MQDFVFAQLEDYYSFPTSTWLSNDLTCFLPVPSQQSFEAEGMMAWMAGSTAKSIAKSARVARVAVSVSEAVVLVAG